MADSIGFVWDGLKEFEAKLAETVTEADTLTRQAVVKAAHIVEAKAKARASGRPGPEVQTGTLRRSIGVHDGPTRLAFGTWTAGVGPTAIYARRVELGFDQADSLGRVYHQPPYPYLRPGLADALDEVGEVFAEAWREIHG